MSFQTWIEKNIGVMVVFIVISISFGGLVEIVPLMFEKQIIEPMPGMKPYPPLELAGRDVYLREGCYLCHSQMIRTLASEVQRYGHYSEAGESAYDHPFQWGSKRTGPDLARVGGKYSDDWHRIHLNNPRDVVPESIMPGFPWLSKATLDPAEIESHMHGLAKVGLPYTAADYKSVAEAVKGKTEMDALIAYLQGLGKYGPKENKQ
jgi:cytochrome c oxidase cbb3-type subunit 2